MRNVVSLFLDRSHPIERVALWANRDDDTIESRPRSFDLEIIVCGVPIEIMNVVGVVAVNLYKQLTGCEPKPLTSGADLCNALERMAWHNGSAVVVRMDDVRATFDRTDIVGPAPADPSGPRATAVGEAGGRAP